MKLAKNVGGIDRTLRLVLGGLAIGVGIFMGWWWLAAIGALIFLSGLVGRCSLYYLFGVNTCPAEKK
jgi:hypothetical protein